MKSKLMLKLLLVLGILAGAIWLSFSKPTKLGLDLKGGVYVVLEAVPEPGQSLDKDAMGRLIEVLDRRINGLGVAESSVQMAGDNRVIIELPGVDNTEDAVKMVGKTALLEFKLKQEDGSLGETLLTGGALKKADVSYDNLGRPQIQFEMTPEGAREFAKITRENVGRQLAITLDGEVQTAPVINGEIPSGSGVITGNYTVEEAKATATLLNAGALPVKAEIAEIRTVGASLGDESIAQSKQAGMLAIVLIWLFMILFYRLPGIVADIALVFFGFITFGVLNFIDATLTLPGIAGLILSAGMAVDANVIIFERIKEELQFGNTIRNAINSGFNKGFVAIFDSNITTLIITIILFTFGTGPVKGFAVTLTIGTLGSMFTAITITKVLLLNFVEIFGFTKPSLFGVKGKKGEAK
ncbi:preprotein translocase subunit SecD [Fusobacterium necrophorum subsp. funduliforme]|uniref:Protein translocase subunit SecD n=6 Tax=Fusobacterium necrophorum TaxID=859 RepID=A0AAN3VU58_9FUSO|nr:protein translocase subunit SecD [Fusobacterium necrophorum]EHO20880.1 protein-export membrane protein SecD [Fusobacterium necrophorum subsp. funduliforme 1_1_36S]AVQ20550.1 protein translocase subunit SecD [Fusobacterium necrophorum subsp. funduliforme]AYV92284.1 protein translocase subunit SecD [Fusobacterium necrophorum subsp. funduliforme]AYV94221.1 protein translocase subunit SecD [Fusobacterium necrophorum subsp. funduliforme]AYZ73333.1 protein translocase subunit SecD [Fusobacterium 